MTGNWNKIHESSEVNATSLGREDTSLALDDMFLIVQRSTMTAGRMYNEFFEKPKSDFLAGLSGTCDIAELKFVRDMMYSVIKRRTASGQLGPSVERKSGDLKDKSVKDIYNLYLFGEETINSLTKNMIKVDTKFVNQEMQTDSVSCLGGSLFAAKAELENLKVEILGRISTLQQTLLPHSNQSSSTSSVQTVSPIQQTEFEPSEKHVSLTSSGSPLPPSAVYHVFIQELSDFSQMQSQPERSRKIVITGDSLLHRMNTSKMSVNGIPSVNITKKGDSLVGSINRAKNYISRHRNNHIDLVLLAGANDLAGRNANPELSIKTLDDQITELKGFNNLGHIFLCKIPHRFDSHVVNSKVVRFNELLHELFSDTEEFLTVVDTIPPEFKFYYEDGLHFSNVGLSKSCRILLSNLYRVLAPSNLKAWFPLTQLRPRQRPISSKNKAIIVKDDCSTL